MKSRFARIVLGLTVTMAVAAIAADEPSAPPSWWQSYGIIFDQSTVSGLSPSGGSTAVSIGQLKSWATDAANYLDDQLSQDGGAGQPVTDAIAALDDSDPSVNATAAQLQSVMQPIYDRLIAAGYNTKASLIANGAGADWSSNYPWATPPPGPGDPAYDPTAYSAWQQQQAANTTTGQVMLDLSFDFGNTTITVVGNPAGNSSVSVSTKSGQNPSGVASTATTVSAESSSAGQAAPATTGFAVIETAANAPTDNAGIALVVLTPLE